MTTSTAEGCSEIIYIEREGKRVEDVRLQTNLYNPIRIKYPLSLDPFMLMELIYIPFLKSNLNY